MPAVVEERNNQRRSSAKAYERRYFIKGVTDEASAIAATTAAVGGEIPTIITTPFGAFPIAIADATFDELDTNRWEAVVPWKPADGGGGSSPGSFSISFDISGQNQRITQSVATRGRYKAASAPDRDFKGAINVQSDGRVEGVDIVIPFTTLTLDYVADPDAITEAYFTLLCRTVGKQNSTPYKGFAAGELLLTRVSGRKRNAECWDLSFGLAVSENQDENSDPGIIIPGINGDQKLTKDGWDYLWVYYDRGNDEGGRTPAKPLYAIIEQVYREADYAVLDLP